MATIPTLLFFVPLLEPCSTAPPSHHHGGIQEKVPSNAQGLLASSVLTQQLGEAVPFSHSGLDLSKFLATKWMIHFRISHCLLCFSRKPFGKCLSLQLIFKSYFEKRKTFASCSLSTWGTEFRSHDRQSTRASPLPLKSLHSIRQSRYTLNYQRIHRMWVYGAKLRLGGRGSRSTFLIRKYWRTSLRIGNKEAWGLETEWMSNDSQNTKQHMWSSRD